MYLFLTLKKEDLKVIFGDEFLLQSVLNDVGLHSTKNFYDHCHLRKNYNEDICPSLYSDWINKILNAKNEENYNLYMQLALSNAPIQPKLIEVLNVIYKRKESFASYVIDSTPGSCCQRGSS